jgi:hypothetical protein
LTRARQATSNNSFTFCFRVWSLLFVPSLIIQSSTNTSRTSNHPLNKRPNLIRLIKIILFELFHYSHPIPSTASRVRRHGAVELSPCAVCFGLLRSVPMSSAECLSNILNALRFENRVEHSSSILYHSSQLPTKLVD